MSDIFADYKKIVRRQVSLAMHTYMQLGGPAEYFAEPRNTEELVSLLKIAQNESIPIRTLGIGSNILVSDDGFPGLVIRLTAPDFGEIRTEGNTVHAGGGAKLGRVITQSVHEGLAGLEHLIGIPGTVGGSVVGNIGSNNDDIGQTIQSVQAVTESGKTIELSRDEIDFGYRESNLDDVIITSVEMRLYENEPFELSKRLQKFWIFRKTTQPMGAQCTGNVFKNPRGKLASELIEKAGLKGTRIGGAIISDRNANFIVAEPECNSSDVLRLIDLVTTQVKNRLDVDLEHGIVIW